MEIGEGDRIIIGEETASRPLWLRLFSLLLGGVEDTTWECDERDCLSL
jgi:hypothetical protein